MSVHVPDTLAECQERLREEIKLNKDVLKERDHYGKQWRTHEVEANRLRAEIERLTRLTGPGMVAVPVEPTEHQIIEMYSALSSSDYGSEIPFDSPTEIIKDMYRTMIAAAQQDKGGKEDGK